MQVFVALLRAVNVGGTGKLSMANLRAMAEEAGLTQVQSYIQSGNLVFASARTPEQIKAALEDRLQNRIGKPVGVVIRSAQQMQQVVAANLFPHAQASKVGVLFLDQAPPPDTATTATGRADEEIQLGEREVFIHYPSGMGRTKLKFAALSKGTMRNINTITKLAQIAAEAANPAP